MSKRDYSRNTHQATHRAPETGSRPRGFVHTPAEVFAMGERTDVETKTCALCGRPALYRQRNKARAWGACKFHKADLNQMGRLFH